MDLFRYIYEGYKNIYDTEEAGVGDPDASQRLYNRSRSNEEYGIWGHYISDLVIESIHYEPEKKVVMMFIGS